MGASFKETNRRAWDVYISVMLDPTTPAGLGLTEIINMGFARVSTQDIPHSNPNGEFPEGARGVRWARNNTEFMEYFNNYKTKGLSKEDKRFSFAMLNDQYQNMIVGQAQMEKVIQCIIELNSLCITPTFRIVKWCARMSWLPLLPLEKSFLRTTSVGCVDYKPNNEPLGIVDVAATYAALEKKETKDKPTSQWESYKIDGALLMPKSAGFKPYTLNFSPHVVQTIQSLNNERNKDAISEQYDYDYRDKLYKALSNK